MNAKLTDTQTAVLEAATERPDGNIEPLPSSLRGGARVKVIEGLLARGLIVDADGDHLLTDAGYATVGKHRPIPEDLRRMDILDSIANLETPTDVRRLGTIIRPGTKLAAIIDAMCRPGGATIAQMMVSTGWQPHSVRGAISGMIRKRLGYTVVAEKGADGQRIYRVA